jgi:hypothetical protein
MSDGTNLRDVNQDKAPNFRDKKGKFFLVRCFVCGGDKGKENYAMAVASGICAWCGWVANEENKDDNI